MQCITSLVVNIKKKKRKPSIKTTGKYEIIHIFTLKTTINIVTFENTTLWPKFSGILDDCWIRKMKFECKIKKSSRIKFCNFYSTICIWVR